MDIKTIQEPTVDELRVARRERLVVRYHARGSTLESRPVARPIKAELRGDRALWLIYVLQTRGISFEVSLPERQENHDE